jgi:CRP-like cAMP-binding protein
VKNQDDDSEVLRRLDAIVRLIALQMTADLKTVEKIRLLGRAGLDRRMIAELAGTTPDAVSVRLSEFKRSTARKEVTSEKTSKATSD